MIKNGGFTLIEVLIYSAIVTVMLTFILLAAYQIIDNQSRLNDWLAVQENQKFLLQKLEWVLQSNQAINIPAIGASGNALSVNKLNFSGNPLIIDLAGGTVRLQSGGGAPVNLTNPQVSVSNLNFNHLNLSGRSAIRVQAVLANITASATIDTLIYAR